MEWTLFTWGLLVGIVGLLWVMVLDLFYKLTARSAAEGTEAPKSRDAGQPLAL
ncbi:hypothetical protein [Candidatus Nitrospira bockiana]